VIRLHAWLVLGGLWAAWATAWAQTPKAEAIAPGVWFVQGVSALGSSANRNFISNAAFVVTDSGVVVIDALGSPPLAAELLAEIRRITDKPVTQVIVTHYHADHVYGLQAFKAAGAEIIAHTRADEYLQSDTARLRLQASREDLFPWVDEATRLLPPDRRLTGPTALTLGGVRFEISHAGPAHTPEDLVIWLPERRVLFVGDLVFRGRIPFVGLADSGAWVQALDRLLAYDAALIVPGHGAVSAQAKDDLRLTRDYLLHLRQSMGRAAAELEPFEDAYAHTDWSRFEHLPLFRAANRINAYNTYLLMERAGR
jgi:glyoxylase-like metal-dependent hydrolase (beta-lactamase superfamily II)